MKKIMVEIYFDMEVFDMGIYIYLDIVPERITQEQWKEVYNKSLKILDEFPFMDIVKKKRMESIIVVVREQKVRRYV